MRALLLLLLLGCKSEPLTSPADLDVGDLTTARDLSMCPGPNIGGSCPMGQICDYPGKRCVCSTGFWSCNDPACPDTPPFSGSCAPSGLSCYYGLEEGYCVDGNWLGCGDAAGLRCMDSTAKEGAVCCPNDFVGPFGGCACFQGRQCSCDNFHIHCVPCDL